MKVVCAPDPSALQSECELAFAMMQRAPESAHGTVARSFRETVRRNGVWPSTSAWDFATLALATAAADHGCLRSQSADGWTREIDLHVALVEPSHWSPNLAVLEDALRFLTGDIWTISIYDGGLSPLPLTKRVKRPQIKGDCVSLLSGGADSLVGAIDLASAGRNPVFVSQVAKGDAVRQRSFAAAVRGEMDHVQLSHATQLRGRTERSQRGRSLVFLAFGALAATAIQRSRGAECTLFVPENGFISYNVPLTPARVGSLSTRTTHPHFLGLIQELWRRVGMRVRIENPYQHKTKGEMLSDCANQELLESLAPLSTSCGRFGTFGYRHCGRCIPCLVRRAAFLAWGRFDSTDYVHSDLGTQNHFDDVRSLSLACIRADAEGVKRWSRNALNARKVGNVQTAVDLVERGMAELKALLVTAGIL